MPQIAVEDLCKTFRVAKRQHEILNSAVGLMYRKHAVVSALQGISFSVDEGGLVGFIGPNGAGKSTTVKVMSGILVPDSGQCLIRGRVPWKQRIEHVREIGVVFGQKTQLWWDVPVRDTFDLLRDVYAVPRERHLKALSELVVALKLEGLLDTPVRQLSLGQRMRCDLAASLLHNPPILFLDEPTIGLDVVSKLAVRDFVRRINRERGVTVILTTHDMDDIEALCSRVMVMGRGRILFDGTMGQLRSTVTCERTVNISVVGQLKRVAPAFARVVAQDDDHIELRFDTQETNAAKLVQEISRVNEIKDFVVQDPPIEDVVARIYGKLGL